MRIVLGLFLVLVVMNGCSSDSDSGGSGTPITGDCPGLSQQVCSALERCTGTAFGARYGTAASCRSEVEADCKRNVTAPDVGTADLASCATWYASTSCDDLLYSSDIPACRTPPGTRADGSNCAINEQCASGYCLSIGGISCGICYATKEVKEGEVCGNPNEPVYAECAAGLDCRSAPKGFDQICVAVGGLSASCDGDKTQCVSGLGCVAGSCQKQGQDAPCAASSECDISGGFVCGPSKLCEPFTVAGPGDECGATTNGLVLCAAAGFCDSAGLGAPGTCKAQIPIGGACEYPDNYCESDGLCSSGAPGVVGVCELPDPQAC